MESYHGPREETQGTCVHLKALQHVGGVEETDHGHSGEEGDGEMTRVPRPAEQGSLRPEASDHLPQSSFNGLPTARGEVS